MAVQALRYKVADSAREFELIHALNYRTFVEEIPQHRPNRERKLVDRFHSQNTYVICLDGDELAGMIALRGARPFSLDEKLSDLQSFLPSKRMPCEIRLLAVAPAYRKTGVFSGLVLRVLEIAARAGYDLALISGTTRQLKLYQHLGFEPFGHLVGKGNALYQPMMLTLERFEKCVEWLVRAAVVQDPPLRLLPGPVELRAEVPARFARRAFSHRSTDFSVLMKRVQDKLCTLSNAKQAAVLLGSGTLANDVVAAQLSARGERGLILANGEFGERLIDHARRWSLEFDVYEKPWGEPFNLAQIEQHLSGDTGWLWFVHCETSTGMLNDLPQVSRICAARRVALCVDAISSVGLLPVDLNNAWLATAVSGKGIGAYPGLAIVFHHGAPRGNAHIPRYLDLALYDEESCVPFTHSSNLLAALDEALDGRHFARQQELRHVSTLLRERLTDAGFTCVAAPGDSAPGLFTIRLPRHISSTDVGAHLITAGYEVAYLSPYLRKRGWIQIALMGAYESERLLRLVPALKATVGHAEPQLAAIF